MDENTEIKQINEREFYIGESRYHIMDNNILSILSVGDIIDKHTIDSHKEITRILREKIDGPINVLIDINKAGRQSSLARKTWQDISNEEEIVKVAYFGLHAVARMLASFVIGIIVRKEIRFFRTKEEALNWLRT